MGATTEVRTRHPRYAEQLNRDAGMGYREVAPMQKVAASALGMRQDVFSRIANGHIASSASRFYEEVWTAAAHRKTNPGPLIARAILAAVDGMASWTLDELMDAALATCTRETRAQYAEDMEQHDLIRALESRDPARLGPACLAYEEKSVDEMGAQVDLSILNRAILVHLGLRVSPENGS